jgi:NAD(P)-dependent dehydrogenase (short-subunit alcohol dehydrogenase family)
MAGRLENKIALITGGGSGLGRATALAFAREGASVVAADLNLAGAEETARLVEETGGSALALKVDVSQAKEVEAMVRRTVEAYGRLDCAFNSAGILGVTGVSAIDYSEEVWDEVLRINLKGIWLSMKYEIPQMLAQGGGAIVNAASVAGLVGSRLTGVAYVASKHGVVGLTRTVALEYAQKGIRINAVCPGWTRTPMTDAVTGGDPEAEQAIAERYPMGRTGVPEDVAEAVLWLCSDAASFTTGHLLTVDGGFVAQ